MGKKIKIVSIIVGVLVLSIITLPQIGYGFVKSIKVNTDDLKEPQVLSTEVWLTAYSSSPDETDSTPFITASGEMVQEGIVATNFLPLYSIIQIPEIFGDRLFVVKDRMHSRKTNFVDIWMSSKEKAKEFGIHQTDILIIDSPATELSLVR